MQGAEGSRRRELDLHMARKEKAAWRARALHVRRRAQPIANTVQHGAQLRPALSGFTRANHPPPMPPPFLPQAPMPPPPLSNCAQAESRFAQLRAVLQARTLQTAASAALQLRAELLPAAVALVEEAPQQALGTGQERAAKKGSGRPRGRPRKVQQGEQAAPAAPGAPPPASTGSQQTAPRS